MLHCSSLNTQFGFIPISRHLLNLEKLMLGESLEMMMIIRIYVRCSSFYLGDWIHRLQLLSSISVTVNDKSLLGFFLEMMHIWWSSIKCVTISSLMPSAHLFSSETCLSLWGRNDPISKNTTSTFFRWNTLSFKRNKSVSQNLKTMMDPISRIAFLGKDLST